MFAHSHFHSSSRRHRMVRVISLALIVLLAYFVWSDSASAEPETVVVLSADFELRQYTAQGALEARPAESRAACACLKDSLTGAVRENPVLDVVALPDLTAAEQAAVDEHVALLSTIANSIQYMAKNPGEGGSGSLTWGRMPSPVVVTAWVTGSRSSVSGRARTRRSS